MTDETIDEERLRDLLARAEALPRSIAPPADAWREIRAVIDQDRGAETSRGRGADSQFVRPGRGVSVIRLWQRPQFLAAAALLLIAGSSAITAIAIGRRGEPERRTVVTGIDARAATQKPPSSAAPASLAEFTVIENEYILTAGRLSERLEAQEDKLSPETVATLKESVRIIDAAILEARRALAADPANAELVEMLSGSYEQKLDLLRRTAEMARS